MRTSAARAHTRAVEVLPNRHWRGGRASAARERSRCLRHKPGRPFPGHGFCDARFWCASACLRPVNRAVRSQSAPVEMWLPSLGLSAEIRDVGTRDRVLEIPDVFVACGGTYDENAGGWDSNVVVEFTLD